MDWKRGITLAYSSLTAAIFLLLSIAVDCCRFLLLEHFLLDSWSMPGVGFFSQSFPAAGMVGEGNDVVVGRVAAAEVHGGAGAAMGKVDDGAAAMEVDGVPRLVR